MKEGIIENLDFSFTPEFKIVESENKEGVWLKIGGTALVEGVSKNNNVYTFKNIQENDGKQFKWLVGHPEETEKHVVGKGSFEMKEGKLMHAGEIRNTAEHPDVVEAVKDGFLGPSIHATADSVKKTDEGYVMEGLSINGVGLVAFQGVKEASIDYAIAESYDRKMSELIKEQKGENTMAEEEQPKEVPKSEEKPVEEPKTEKPVEEPKTEEKPSEEEKKPEESVGLTKVMEAIKELKEENKLLKEALEGKKEPESAGVVETEIPDKDKGKFVESNGFISVSESDVKVHNLKLKEALRGE